MTDLQELRNPSLRSGLVNWGLTTAGLLANRGATAIILAVMAQRSSVLAYGQYTAAFSLAAFLISFAQFGLDPWILTRGKSQSAEVGALWGKTLRLRSLFLAVWLLGMLGLSFFLPASTYQPAILLPVVLGVAMETVSLLSFSALRTLNRHLAITILQSLPPLALLLIVWYLPAGLTSMVWFAQIRGAMMGITALLAIWLMGPPNVLKKADQIPYRQILRESLPFMWSEVASTIYYRADINLVSILIGPSGSGIYGAALNLLQVAFLIPQGLFLSIMPSLSSAYRGSNQKSFHRIGLLQWAALAVLGFGMSLMLYFFSSPIVQLVFGSAFLDTARILRLLSPIPFLRSINFAMSAILASSNHQVERSRFQIMSALFNVLANLVVIRPFGIPGVAIVFSLSEGILAIGLGTTSFRIFKSRSDQNTPPPADDSRIESS